MTAHHALRLLSYQAAGRLDHHHSKILLDRRQIEPAGATPGGHPLWRVTPRGKAFLDWFDRQDTAADLERAVDRLHEAGIGPFSEATHWTCDPDKVVMHFDDEPPMTLSASDVLDNPHLED